MFDSTTRRRSSGQAVRLQGKRAVMRTIGMLLIMAVLACAAFGEERGRVGAKPLILKPIL
jgi:hypothetical protein